MGSAHEGPGEGVGVGLCLRTLPLSPDGLASFEQERAVSCSGICLSFLWLLL